MGFERRGSLGAGGYMGGSFVIDGFGLCQSSFIVHASSHDTSNFNDTHSSAQA